MHVPGGVDSSLAARVRRNARSARADLAGAEADAPHRPHDFGLEPLDTPAATRPPTPHGGDGRAAIPLFERMSETRFADGVGGR